MHHSAIIAEIGNQPSDLGPVIPVLIRAVLVMTPIAAAPVGPGHAAIVAWHADRDRKPAGPAGARLGLNRRKQVWISRARINLEKRLADRIRGGAGVRRVWLQFIVHLEQGVLLDEGQDADGPGVIVVPLTVNPL